jgi:hypothetical protein
VDARVQVAGIDPRRNGRHTAQRSRYARADQIGRNERAEERKDAREDESARHAPLGVGHHRERLACPDRHARATGQREGPLEQPQIADVGEGER